VAVRLNELARKGEDFCLPVIAPAELPVIISQVQPDRFQANSLFPLDFIPISQLK
jgi:hypothetical protein